MSSLHTLIASLGCIIVGAFLLRGKDGDATGILLVSTGIAGITASSAQAHQKAKVAEKKTQEMFEETQTLRRERDRERDHRTRD